MPRTMPEQLRFVKCIIAFFVLAGIFVSLSHILGIALDFVGLIDCPGTGRGE